MHSFLPYYYAIKGKRKDGYTHVLYLNGGHPTWGMLDYVKLAGMALCTLSPHRYNMETFLQSPQLSDSSSISGLWLDSAAN